MVPNNGDSSVLMFVSLLAGYHLTTQIKSFKVKKTWMYASTPPYAFIAQCLIESATFRYVCRRASIKLRFLRRSKTSENPTAESSG
jgi:hypothetical protein